MDNIVQFPNLGISFTLNRVALSIGGFNIYWYGILIALGLVLAMVFAFHYAPDFGIDSDRLIDVILVGTVMSVVFARIYYVAFAPFQYDSIWQMIDIRQGGIAIYGAIIGAFLFGGLMAKIRKVPLLPLFDLTALGFLIGQGIGRWGNFVNQEAFGTNTTLPWGMYSDGTYAYLSGVKQALAAEGVTVDPSLPVHPTFLYESIWCLAGLLVLWLVFLRRRRFHGEVFLLYVIWYGLGRYWIEGLRTDSLMMTSTLRTSQIVALLSIAASVVLLVAGLQRSRGTTLMVPLAVSDIKKQQKAGNRFTVDELKASASHAEFVKATAEMNQRLAELKLDETVAGAAETAKQTAAEKEAAAETKQTADKASALEKPKKDTVAKAAETDTKAEETTEKVAKKTEPAQKAESKAEKAIETAVKAEKESAQKAKGKAEQTAKSAVAQVKEKAAETKAATKATGKAAGQKAKQATQTAEKMADKAQENSKLAADSIKEQAQKGSGTAAKAKSAAAKAKTTGGAKASAKNAGGTKAKTNGANTGNRKKPAAKKAGSKTVTKGKAGTAETQKTKAAAEKAETKKPE